MMDRRKDNRATFGEFGVDPRELVEVSKRSQESSLFRRVCAAPFGIDLFGV